MTFDAGVANEYGYFTFFTLLFQPILDCACSGSTIWLIPASNYGEVASRAPEVRVKVRRSGLCISTFPAIFSFLSPSLREFLSRGGGQGLSVGAASSFHAAVACTSEEIAEAHDEENRWRHHAELHAVSVTAAHVFFSCIRFSSYPSQLSASSPPPALRISRGGCGVVLIDCRASSPGSAAIVCHVKHISFDDHRSATPAYFCETRSAAASPTFSRPNSMNRSNSSSPTLLQRTGTFASDGNSSPKYGRDGDLLDMMTFVGWRCRVQNSVQGFGCVRARCILLQCTLQNFTQSACESHGQGSQLQLVRCHLQQCSGCMLVCNSSALLHVTATSFEQCYSAARSVDRSSLVIFDCAMENVSHSAVTVTLESSLFCRNCSLAEVGLEYCPQCHR